MKKGIFLFFFMTIILNSCTTNDAIATNNDWIATKKSNFSFYEGECSGNLDPYSQPMAGILAQEWEKPDKLVIRVYIKTYCGGATITGDYQLEGIYLKLYYFIKTGTSVTSCNCTHYCTYIITGLEKREYIITIEYK